MRYLPLLTQAGYEVSFKCSKPGLGKLLRQSLGDGPQFKDELTIKNSSMPLHAPTFLFQMMYLPRAFNGKLTPGGVGSGRPSQKLEYKSRKKTKPYIPSHPYLRADPARVEHYRKRIAAGAIGLCWASGVVDSDPWIKRVQPITSMRLADMALLFEQFPCVSLQVGRDRAQLAGTPVLDVLPERPDWSETAALVKACRAIVTVDTGVVHLAGGLGAPVHLLMHPEPTAYFNVGGVASPWYPHIKVYRGRGGDWSDAVARILAALDAGL